MGLEMPMTHFRSVSDFPCHCSGSRHRPFSGSADQGVTDHHRMTRAAQYPAADKI